MARHLGRHFHGAGKDRWPSCGSVARQYAHQGSSRSQRRTPHKKGVREQDRRAIGTSRGGKNTKIHLIADAHGRPKVICLTGGQRHDSVPAQAMLALLPADLRVIADAAYDSKDLREWLGQRGSRIVIPNRKNRKKPYPFDGVTYKRRNIVERTFCRLKDFRRLAARYDRLDETFISTLCIAAALAYFLK
jgi:transposase